MMWSNTKLLISFCITLITLGIFILWFGLKPTSEYSESSPVSTPIIEVPPSATASAVAGIEGELVYVTKVIDGDTIKIEGDITIRLLGVDTPETVDPRRPVGCFGKEASNQLKSLLSGKVVILQKDISENDKYKRLLRYIYLPLENGQTLFVNDYLIREGFAKVLTIPPDVKYAEQFLEAQRKAREAKKGLWGMC